ncbi:MAG: tetratricopeptide repeat protein, partial [Algicola sp.]|nr:tetratricopeptide repeat protein [Algicola sp.]
AIKLALNDATAHNNLGGLLTDHFSQHKAAKACFDKAIELDPSSSFYYTNLGHTTSRLNRFKAAKACYEKAIELDPRNAKALKSLGMLLDDHFYEPALVVECFKKVLVLAPRYSQANKLRAKIAEYESLAHQRLSYSSTLEAESVFASDWPTMTDTDKSMCEDEL